MSIYYLILFHILNLFSLHNNLSHCQNINFKHTSCNYRSNKKSMILLITLLIKYLHISENVNSFGSIAKSLKPKKTRKNKSNKKNINTKLLYSFKKIFNIFHLKYQITLNKYSITLKKEKFNLLFKLIILILLTNKKMFLK
jgi:hypothetical protein